MASTRLGCLHPSTGAVCLETLLHKHDSLIPISNLSAGANNHAVHRFPGADIQLVLCVPCRKGRGRREREAQRLCQLRRRTMVGSNNGYDDRLRRYRTTDLDGENSSFRL